MQITAEKPENTLKRVIGQNIWKNENSVSENAVFARFSLSQHKTGKNTR